MSELQLGNVPEWVSISLSALALYRSTVYTRKEWVGEWFRFVEEMADMTSDEIAAAASSPAVTEIVTRALEAASRSANEDKRRLLAKVAVSALRHADSAQPDEWNYYVRTLETIEPPHVRLLVTLIKQSAVQGSRSRSQTTSTTQQRRLRRLLALPIYSKNGNASIRPATLTRSFRVQREPFRRAAPISISDPVEGFSTQPSAARIPALRYESYSYYDSS